MGHIQVIAVQETVVIHYLGSSDCDHWPRGEG
jgi:hypothetical protein